MRRHSWKDTGQKPDSAPLAVDPDATMERCEHCRTERVKDRDYKTGFFFRNGTATSSGRWVAFAIRPQCVAR
jgi:hypothetical protein